MYMLDKLKSFGIVATIAVLFTIFIFALTNAIVPQPEYNDFCNYDNQKNQRINWDECPNTNMLTMCDGEVDYILDENNCPIDYTCDDCGITYKNEQNKHDLVLFLVSSIVGLIAILFGLFCIKRTDYWTLIKAGFLLGGLISLFVGTGIYYDSMARFLKPIVMFVELVIILLVTYKIISKGKKK